jgi:anti-sigma B factor antagonist
MFRIGRGEDGAVMLEGRLTAAEADQAREFLDTVNGTVVLDFTDLAYISSAGLGILIALHHRLAAKGDKVRCRNLNRNVGELFRIAGFSMIFDIE